MDVTLGVVANTQRLNVRKTKAANERIGTKTCTIRNTHEKARCGKVREREGGGEDSRRIHVYTINRLFDYIS